VRSNVADLYLLTGILACGLSLGCSPHEPGQVDRYARRVVPPSDEVTMESKISVGRPGIWELSLFPPGTQPTPEQQRAADDLVRRTHEAALRHGWYDVRKGVADGFVQAPTDPNHYQHAEYKLDDQILNPDRPEYLMYYGLDGKIHLTGIMYFARTRTERGPQIGGPLTVWHIHHWVRGLCFVQDLLPVGEASLDGTCSEGVPKFSSGEMLHVWLMDRNTGPFTSSMVVPPEDLRNALNKRFKEHGY
jgi:hypothetical protein